MNRSGSRELPVTGGSPPTCINDLKRICRSVWRFIKEHEGLFQHWHHMNLGALLRNILAIIKSRIYIFFKPKSTVYMSYEIIMSKELLFSVWLGRVHKQQGCQKSKKTLLFFSPFLIFFPYTFLLSSYT